MKNACIFKQFTINYRLLNKIIPKTKWCFDERANEILNAFILSYKEQFQESVAIVRAILVSNWPQTVASPYLEKHQ